MTTDEKARALIMDAWIHFWRHSGDPSAYYCDYISDDELDAVIAHAEKIVNGTS